MYICHISKQTNHIMYFLNFDVLKARGAPGRYEIWLEPFKYYNFEISGSSVWKYDKSIIKVHLIYEGHKWQIWQNLQKNDTT